MCPTAPGRNGAHGPPGARERSRSDLDENGSYQPPNPGPGQAFAEKCACGVAFAVTPASTSEQPTLRALIRDIFTETPELAERCADFSADRGLDSAETKALLWDAYAIRPLIDTRELWREEKQHPDYDPRQPITRPLDPERADPLVYTEKGTMHCFCPATGEQRDLAFQGFEADRNTLKYRCPAAAYDLECQGQTQGHHQGGVNPGEYGRIVRIKLE